ncbi:MAG: SgcJ/EcaC family oxidoreductase [Thermomicrobia bacterium]|nr:SgcJ/EcaC family oxidoreductase [Thermomicrobia bacterium]MCA1724787.1 SgcJ/EcaC family oxidoreductase [Thermomicrobia bacterium]
MLQADTIQTVVDGYFAANNALDADAVATLFAPDAQMHRVPGTPPAVGRETIRQVYGQVFAALAPRSEVHAVDTFIAGNGAAVLYRGRYVMTSGESVPVEGIDVFEINAGGQIEAIRYYWDPAPLMGILRR